VTDGDSFVCLRYATPGREAPSLYWSTMAGARMDRQYRGEPDGGAGDASARSGEEHEPHVVVASEPMTKGRDEQWHLLGNGEWVSGPVFPSERRAFPTLADR
jgi:glutamine amidotransferase